MKFRLPQKRRYRIPLYSVSILLILLAVDLVWVRIDRHITVSSDTTRITAPLKPDGMPDYIKWMDDRGSAGVTPENNAAAVLQQAFGPVELRRLSSAEEVYSRLGLALPQNDAATTYFEPFIEYPNPPVPIPPVEMAGALTGPWAAADNVRLAASIEKNAHSLELLHQAAARPRYFFPMVKFRGQDSAASHLLGQIGPIRQLGQLACARAMLRLSSGQLDEAHDDLLAVHKLARLLAQQPTGIEFGVAARLEKDASVGDIAIAASDRISEPQARRFLVDLQVLPEFPTLAEAIEGERMFALDIYIFGARNGLGEALKLTGGPGISEFKAHILFALIPANFNDAMRGTNQYFDRLIAAARDSSFSRGIATVRAIDEESGDINGSAWDAATVIRAYLRSNYSAIFKLRDSSVVTLDLARIACALAAYHVDHASYPDALPAIVPSYLVALPNDRFLDGPFRYIKTPKGYLLYSVGPNGQDEAGYGPQHPHSYFRDADDISVRVGQP